MKTLVVQYPEEIKCMIISHATFDQLNGRMGVRVVCTDELEEGMVTIDPEKMVVDRQSGEVVKE